MQSGVSEATSVNRTSAVTVPPATSSTTAVEVMSPAADRAPSLRPLRDYFEHGRWLIVPSIVAETRHGTYGLRQ